MMKQSRFVAAALVMGASAVLATGASGDAATDNVAFVDGKVSPKKLSKKQFKKVGMFVGVRTQGVVDGTQANPKSELISFGANVKLKPRRAPRCQAPLPNGATPEQARGMCPRKSYLGRGEASIQFPGLAPVDDVTVSVFGGPGKRDLRLHTYSPTLGTASPTVSASVVRSPAGKAYRHALVVPNAPETGAGMITKFNAKIKRSSGVVTARCRSRKFRFERRVTYADGSVATAVRTQRCKRRGR